MFFQPSVFLLWLAAVAPIPESCLGTQTCVLSNRAAQENYPFWDLEVFACESNLYQERLKYTPRRIKIAAL